MPAETIGRLAKRCGIGVETIRFYEKKGLVPRPPRSASGFRRYSPDTALRIRFIRRAQTLGFSLREIRDLLSLRVDAGTTCGDIKRRAEEKIADIEERIRALREMREALARLAAACRGLGPTGECPILEALEGEAAIARRRPP